MGKRIWRITAAAALLLLSSCTVSTVQEDTQVPQQHEESMKEVFAVIPENIITRTQMTPDDNTVRTFESEKTLTYENPLIRVNETNTWKDYGVGDPFVMRYNGRYYLYCSTKDWDTGIQCWTSDNLVKWTYHGLCATENLTMSAYAPEVVYYNGAFYMYTSPAGKGHYVLKSDSPTGPFTAVTENFGLSIDGDVFIDDDGKWYFYSAGSNGIMAYTMVSPTEVQAGSGVNTHAYMNGWTEGSMILKYGGKYYMTYTGNHVWCDGYRIDCAVSDTSPVSFTPMKNNPILLSTDASKVKGIGHSSTVLAPDLDGYYIVYHSSIGAPKREMNIDRMVMNGSRLDVLGPTRAEQERSAMPEVYSRFEYAQNVEQWFVKDAAVENRDDFLTVQEGGYVLSKTAFADRYTAEVNLLSLEGEAGMYLDFTDENNCALLTYDTETYRLTLSVRADGVTTNCTAEIEGSFGEKLRSDALILLTVRKYDGQYEIFVNNRLTMTAETPLDGGVIGVTSVRGKAAYGFVGISSHVMQSGVKALHKNIDGLLPAFTCVEEELSLRDYDGANYVSVQAEQTYHYLVRTQQTGAYDLVVSYRSETGAVLEFFENGASVGTISLPAGETNTVVRGISLSEGTGTLAFRVDSGSADILSYEFLQAAEVQTVEPDSVSDAAYRDGGWAFSNGVLKLRDRYGKWLIGEEGWGDYTVEADITPTSDQINFGLLVRAKNPSKGGANDSVPAGTDFVQGYFVGLGKDRIFLGKQNYSWKELVSESAEIQKDRSYHVKVTVSGTEIRVWLDGEMMITHTDPEAFVQGRAGVRGHDSTAEVTNFIVYPNK